MLVLAIYLVIPDGLHELVHVVGRVFEREVHYPRLAQCIQISAQAAIHPDQLARGSGVMRRHAAHSVHKGDVVTVELRIDCFAAIQMCSAHFCRRELVLIE